ncbi:TetR/AcrR family transcriptional regulator [Luteococcus sp. Sow4_B9]|uniref:TetR/AcrR family transcriptional regulator n=1 Tax=Luteococcus sp. Sow4_B9 TaxID=3438792 RepID=UPI003F95CC64
MAKDVRERMVAGATTLLASKGLQATSFSEVIELTDTPRGSIYHHFPGGKDELVLAALDRAGQQMLTALSDSDGTSAEDVLATVVATWRTLLEGSQVTTGCAAVAVTVATESEELLGAASHVFASWQERLTALFAGGGLTADKAAEFAALSLATVEGAVVIARAKRSMAAYDQAVALLPTLLAALKG